VIDLAFRQWRRCPSGVALGDYGLKLNLLLVGVATAVLGLSAGASSAAINLGAASNFAIIAGPGAKSFQSSNSVINGNVGIDFSGTIAGGNYVQFSSGTINGDFDFAGAAQNSLGAGTLTGVKNANDANISSAYNTISSLSSAFALETGNSISSNMLDATSGHVDGNGNFVFTTTASGFLSSDLTISGGINQSVVINVTGNNNVQLSHQLTLTGGITSDNVFINILGSGQQLSGTNNGGAVDGVIVALGDKVNIDNTTINGRLIGGGSNQDFQVVSGFRINAPVGGVPEPATWALMLLGFGGLGTLLRVQRSNLKRPKAAASVA